jgi:hypothetical protein
MAKRALKISGEWIVNCREDFRVFLEETSFPDPKRNDKRDTIYRGNYIPDVYKDHVNTMYRVGIYEVSVEKVGLENQ